MKILVTGGAGFIGSHLIDFLMKNGHEVFCIDDLSLGKIRNIESHIKDPLFHFLEKDMTDLDSYEEIFKGNSFDTIFHLAANSDIQASIKDTSIDYNKTFFTTYNTLLLMQKYNVKELIFASSSAVYGDLNKKLSENTGPLTPISYYGAAKLSSEAFISAFVENVDIKAWIFRFPNVIGDRLTHGVIFDFMHKLQDDPKKLEILGNGLQEKPYIYVSDLIEAINIGWQKAPEKLNCFNVGVDTKTTVNRIAQIIVEEMGLKDVEYIYSGGNRGWTGDVPSFEYDSSKIRNLGWEPKHTSDEAVNLTVKKELNK